MSSPLKLTLAALLWPLALAGPPEARGALAPGEARAIAREAYVYGFPLVDSYRIVHSFLVDREGPDYLGPFNAVHNIPRLFTPEDQTVQTPNSDTPYSVLGLDLRAEPLVLTLPAIESGRYFSVQLIDAYTFNFDYLGSRVTGNGGGSFLVAGPGWKGDAPKGIKKVLRSETNLALALFRTQLFDAADLENVKKVQEGYTTRPLSSFLGKPAPLAAPQIVFIQPLTPEEQKTSLEFFNVLNFVLQFCPTHPAEQELMNRFARIGVGAGRRLDVGKLAPEVRQALAAGMDDAWKELGALEKTGIASGKVTMGELFGSREALKSNYLYRFAAAVLGIYGNSKQEAIYPALRVDADGQPLDASRHRYALRFPPGQLPPVNAFWSVTMYSLPESLLVANPLNRYLVNSPMLPGLKLDADGGLTLHLQKDSPGADRQANWLPAPDGPFWASMRLYWPKEEALDGRWKAPVLARVP